jgi:hypothetical protein
MAKEAINTDARISERQVSCGQARSCLLTRKMGGGVRSGAGGRGAGSVRFGRGSGYGDPPPET